MFNYIYIRVGLVNTSNMMAYTPKLIVHTLIIIEHIAYL